MKDERSVIIIPNEKNLDVPVYCKVSKELYHSEMYQQFSLLYLDQVCDKFDLLEQGHILIESVDDLVTCWLPKSITVTQMDHLLNSRKFLEKFKNFDAGIFDEEGLHLIFEDAIDNIQNKLDSFYENVREKCFEGRGAKL